MTDREKLIELLHNGVRCPSTVDGECWDCPHHSDDDPCDAYGATADMLIAHGVTVQKWISVEDKLPDSKVNCIVHYRHSYCECDGYWAIGSCFYNGNNFEVGLAYKVTHWMPMPKPPKEDEA